MKTHAFPHTPFTLTTSEIEVEHEIEMVHLNTCFFLRFLQAVVCIPLICLYFGTCETWNFCWGAKAGVLSLQDPECMGNVQCTMYKVNKKLIPQIADAKWRYGIISVMFCIVWSGLSILYNIYILNNTLFWVTFKFPTCHPPQPTSGDAAAAFPEG